MSSPAYHPFRSEQAKNEYLAHYTQRAKAWPVESETRLIDTSSGQTFVRVSGLPTEAPLILLPGSRAHSLTWMLNIAALSAHYHTYALDCIYDIGLSVRRRKIKKLDDLLLWLDEILAELEPDGKLRLVGISYGAWLASQYALRSPHRLEKLVLISPAATILPVSFAFTLRAISLLLPGTAFHKKFLLWLLQDTLQSGEAGRAIVEQAIQDWIIAQRCFAPLPIVAPSVMKDQELQSLRVPTLFLLGEHEKVFSAPKAARRLQRVAPQIKFKIIPRAGHDVWIAQVELVNRCLLGFLGES